MERHRLGRRDPNVRHQLGEIASDPVWGYVGRAALQSIFYATVMLVIGALAFRRRDFS